VFSFSLTHEFEILYYQYISVQFHACGMLVWTLWVVRVHPQSNMAASITYNFMTLAARRSASRLCIAVSVAQMCNL